MLRFECIFLHILRTIGVFAIAQRLTRGRVRILCYHGFSYGDEYEVLPFLFMRASTFRRRMEILRRRRIAVLSLNEALRRLQNHSVDRACAVITMDDGWASNLTIGLPVLETYGFPATIYVTTEHLSAGPEAFNVALYYILQKTAQKRPVLSGIHPGLDGEYDLSKPEAAAVKMITQLEGSMPLIQRQNLLGPIARALQVDINDVFRNGRFLLLSGSQIRTLSDRGLAIELHSHTHQLPANSFDDVAWEISLNRRALSNLVGSEPNHFCYPSGIYSVHHPEWLKRLGVKSATTCDSGLNGPDDSVMLLKRYLDSDATPDIVFEAEVSGLREIVRRIKAVCSFNRKPRIRNLHADIEA
jgi:peptidoglycan/xylan/chitin deacetylase (PgdA/CDA1 family)